MVAEVGFNRLLAQKKVGSDLRVRLPVADERGDFELSFRERLDAAVTSARDCPAMDAASKLSQLALELVSIAHCSPRVEDRGRAFEFAHRVALPAVGG